MASLEVRFYWDTMYIFSVKICSTIHTWAQKVYLSSMDKWTGNTKNLETKVSVEDYDNAEWLL